MSTIATYADNSQAVQEPFCWDVEPLADNLPGFARDILAGIGTASSSRLGLDIFRGIVEQSAWLISSNWLLSRRPAGVAGRESATDASGARRGKTEAEVMRLRSLLLSGYEKEHQETWEYLKKSLDEDRLSDRKFFS